MHAVVTAAAVCSAALVAAPAASAATAGARTAPGISGLEVSPDPISGKSADKVSATDTFVTDGDASKVSAFVDAPGRGGVSRLALTKQDLGSGKAKWTAKRDFDRGDRAGTWNFLVYARNDDGRDRERAHFSVKQVQDTRFRSFHASPSRVTEGDRITVSGRLLADSGRHWREVRGAEVDILFRSSRHGDWQKVATTRTRRDGEFRTRVRAEKSGFYKAQYAGSSTLNGSESDTDWVSVRQRVSRSWIRHFDASPEPVTKGEKVTVSGDLSISHHSDGWQRVEILFKADGSREWRSVGTDRTDRRGEFSAQVTADSTGWWRAVYHGRHGSRGTSSRPDRVEVTAPKAETRFSWANAHPEPVRRGGHVRVDGRLLVKDGDNWVTYDHQKVALYFKARHSDKWHYVKTDWTSRSGRYHFSVRDWHSGWWRVSFAGNDTSAASDSHADYVSVR
jgi:hypothetical protein